MTYACEYCQGNIAQDALKCPNCGAPVSQTMAQGRDYRLCPFCARKLLALGSPACSYCGRRLPDEYIKEREAQLRRMSEVENQEIIGEAGKKVDGMIRQTGRLRRDKRSSTFDFSDILDLTDLFF
jgi:predicted amidophosphoribosyltransferase